MVGAVRLELTTSCTRNKRATRLRYAPTQSSRREKIPPRSPSDKLFRRQVAPRILQPIPGAPVCDRLTTSDVCKRCLLSSGLAGRSAQSRLPAGAPKGGGSGCLDAVEGGGHAGNHLIAPQQSARAIKGIGAEPRPTGGIGQIGGELDVGRRARHAVGNI